MTAAGLFFALGYVGLTGGAFGPASELPGATEPKRVLASISHAGPDPVITGSIQHLFEAPGFVGPNRAEKTDRFRPPVDVLDLTRGFEAARARIAALRVPLDDPALLGQSRVADAGTGENADEDGPRMSVASIGGAVGASALDAIDGIAPTGASSVPMPTIASEQLAYARATAPLSNGYVNGEVMEVADRELHCLATAIYFEARGESYRGQVAVAQVVLNRVKDHRYPNTICGVVYQNQHRRNACQFSFACDGIPDRVNDRRSWAQAEEIAGKVTKGELYLVEVAGATHYHATYVRPAWAPRMNRVAQIGLHIFYKFRPGWRFG